MAPRNVASFNNRLLLVIGLVGWATLALLCAGCGASPTAPSTQLLTFEQAWAAAHAGEVCVLTTSYVDGQYIDRGVLVPASVWATYPPTVRTMPISYCNPDE